MLFNLPCFSFLFGLKRKLESISYLAVITLFILCFLINSNQAGVIKKRATNTTETPSGNIVFPNKETELEDAVLTTQPSASVATKIETATDSSLTTGTSKELTHNEIVFNETKAANQTFAVEKNYLKDATATDNFQDLQQITNNLGNKEKTTRDSNEFTNNDIKEEKIQKFGEKPLENANQNENTPRINKHSSLLDSNLRNENNHSKSLAEGREENPIQHNKNEQELPSSILTEPTERSAATLNTENKPLDNSIENSKEKQNLKSESKADLELTTSNSLVDNEEKVLEASADIFKIKVGESLPNTLETFTSASKITENLEVFHNNSIVPFKVSGSANQIKSLGSFSSPRNQSKLEEEKFVDATPDKTIMGSLKKEDLLVFEGDKKQYARSMFMEEITTLKPADQGEELFKPEVTTTTPIKLSIKEGIPELKKDQFAVLNNTNNRSLNIKEKKPKFINDNSTNAQQLHLPNNAEVWSLAAMKSLPKSNVTMETAHGHDDTLKEIKAEQNTSTSSNNNSEKSLLDWSQIMMDKELSSTARNEDPGVTPLEEIKQIKKQPEDEEEDVTINSLTEQNPLTTSTISPVFTTTIISATNNKENNNANLSLADKRVEENMNNHIETLTANFASTNVDINPFNTSLSIEPNLNEINLTSNQTKADLNNDVHSTTQTTTAAKQTASDDVKTNDKIQPESSTVAAETPTTTTASTTSEASAMATLSTTATAVHNDITTVEQISSETTTVSSLETAKQNVSLNSVVIIEQRLEFNNKTYNVNKEESNSTSHNELDNNLLDKSQLNQYENGDSITKITTTTVVPITTFRPTILAITSTTSKAKTLEQEVDQKSNEIQTNSTNTQQQRQQQSIIKFDLQQSNNTTTAIPYETTTFETLTTPLTATKYLRTTSQNANSRTSSPWENETTTTTSSSRDAIINETTEINLDSSVETTTHTTPKQVVEQKYEVRFDEETATRSAVLIDQQKFENKLLNQNTTATTTESNLLRNTLTETPVAITTHKDQNIFEHFAPTTETAATTTTVFADQSLVATTATTKNDTQENIFREEVEEDVQTTTRTAATASTKIMNNTQESATTSSISSTTNKKELETYITLLDDTTTTTRPTSVAAQSQSTTISTPSSSHTPAPESIKTTTTTITTTPSFSFSSSSTLPSPVTTKVEEIYNVINSTTTEVIQTTTLQLLTDIAEESTHTSTEPATAATTTTIAYLTEMLPPATTPPSQMLPTNGLDRSLPTLTSIMGGNSGNMYTKNSQASGETDVNVIIATTVSVIGVIALILLVGFLYLMRKRQKQTSYSQRCRPVSLDEYTIDNASVGDSMRKSNALRASKRTYGNLAFDDPSLRHNPMGVQELTKFVQEKLRIFEEFRDVPQITSHLDEVPVGCEDKNRYANVLPLPETRVILQRLNDDEKSEYINANYVTGTKDPPNYYIACQAPLESTVEDFWRMIWEQQSRVIIQATDLIENGVEKCAEYLPPSVTLDNHSIFGDFQVTLQNREVKDKYAISTLLLKHVGENATRELTHYWYKWPEKGVPTEEAPIIAMLLEARSSLISYAIEQANEDKEKSSVATLKSAEEGTVTTNSSIAPPTNNSNAGSANSSATEINGNISMVHIKKAARNQGPLTVHCSPGTGRTGTIIACDIAIRSLESPKRIVDIPQIVYYVRRGRASAVLTKEQYEFIYKVANMYAAKITNPTNYN